MAVAYDAPSSGSTTTGTPASSLTIAHTTTGANRLLLACVTLGGTTTGITVTAKYAGVSMTSIGSKVSNSNFGFITLFGLLAPATSANNIVFTLAGGSLELTGGGVSFTGVDQTTGWDGLQTPGGTAASSMSQAVTSAVGNMVCDCMSQGTSITSSTQTNRWIKNLNGNSSCNNSAMSTAAGAASVTMGYNFGGSDEWQGVMVNVRAAAASTFVAPKPFIVGQAVQRAAVR